MMAYPKIQIRVPGKLMIAGEYAVLEPYQKAMVVAVDRYITATIQQSSENHLSLKKQGLEDLSWKYRYRKVYFNKYDPRLHFVRIAIETVYRYFREKSKYLKPFRLSITSDLDDVSGRKYGLGSSAAVVVAVISSILHLHQDGDNQPSPELVFKLSAIAHLKAQGSGSGADVAASTFGGWVLYSSFQPEWLLKWMAKERQLTKILEKSWPYLTIEKLIKPSHLHLCVGWTGKPAKTGPLIKSIQMLREKNPLEYKQFLKDSANAVDQVVNSFKENDSIGAIAGLEQNRRALSMLGMRANTLIETEELAKLAQLAKEHNGAGKPSGAGGGDCGIAFILGKDRVEEICEAWKSNDIIPLDLFVSQHGAIAKHLN